MNFITHCSLLYNNPLVFLRILRDSLYRIPYIYALNLLPLLRVLVMQLGIVLVGVFLAVTGRLEPTISADVISITNARETVYVISMAITFVLAVALVLGILATAWWDWYLFVSRKQADQARKCFASTKQKWPWCAPLVLEKVGCAAERYKYKPIADGAIRLLRVVQVGSDDAKRFDCELVHMSLNDRPISYLAMSYTWGNLPPGPKIFFENNQFLEVTESVEVILDSLLAPRECVHLWIDSICIDQNNTEEKNRQVLLMRDIYSHAHQVVISLREPNPTINEAIDFIIPLQEALKKIQHPLYGSSLVSGLDMPRLHKAGINLSKEPWIALGELFSRQWWNRVWVIQEAALGNNPVFICGNRAVEWDIMAYVVKEILLNGTLSYLFAFNPKDPKVPRVEPIKAATHLDQMAATRGQLQMKSLPDIQDVLMEMVGYDATDQRDKIYGLLGLSKDRDNEQLKPDYKLPTNEAYVKTARYILEKKNSIIILNRAGVSNSPYVKDLPSWVPDWYSGPASEAPLCFGKGWAQYRASGSLPSRVTPASGDILTISGITVDNIQEVSSLRRKHAERLLEDGKLFSKRLPDNEMRFLDLEDERKITVEWIREHQKIMLDTFPGDVLHDRTMLSRWKQVYKRTILAADPHKLPGASFDPEFNRVWDLAASPPQVTNSSKPLTTAPKDAKSAEQCTLFHQRFLTATTNRPFFRTERGRIGIGGADTAKGDIVVVFLGGSTPFVIRRNAPVGSGSGGAKEARGTKEGGGGCSYRLLGETYVEGLMSGEAVQGLKEADERIVQFNLI